MAAVIIGLLLVSTFLLLSGGATITHQTTYGETKRIMLPDSSVITLNAHSKLTYDSHWKMAQVREVRLEGEAFLQVLKKPGLPSAKFVVHTHQLKVEVLGTAFNVNNRHARTRVVLNSGSVKVQPEKSSGTSNMVLSPGEMVEFSEETRTFTRKRVNPQIYSSWRNDTLSFADNTVQEIAQILEDNYGLQILIQDPLLRERKLTGEIPSTDEQTVLAVLAETLNIHIARDGRKVVLETKE
jgi:ferric-dicitrate binding protein FerR (iron transport regulator)